MYDLRPLLFTCGIVLSILACFMTVPAIIDACEGHENAWAFAGSALLTLFVGLGFIFSTYSQERPDLDSRQALLLTVFSWLTAILACSIPFYLSGHNLTLADSVFEATSGLTATGATVMVGLDTLPSGILIWRSLIIWFGGIGIVLFAVALLPLLKIGGMQVFKIEYGDKNEKVKARMSQLIWSIFIFYNLMIGIITLLFVLGGMSFFDAINHAASIMATGGFSTSDLSFGKFNDPYLQWIAIIGMTIGGMTFTIFLLPWRRMLWMIIHDQQIRSYLLLLLGISLVLGIWRWSSSTTDLTDSIRLAAFSVVSVVTTTGLGVEDYSTWGGFSQAIFFFLLFSGACTGSTTGGIKVFRYLVLLDLARVQMKKLLYPNGVFAVSFNREKIADPIVRSILGFLFLYLLTFTAFSVLVSVQGVDFITSISSVAASMGNVGPGLGDIVGPSGTYRPLPDTAKWLLSGAMLLGRLELMTIFILFTRVFWKG